MSTESKIRIKRFTPVQRCFHLMLMLAFLIQAATGLGRMYIETSWGKAVTWVFGGYEMSRDIHVAVGFLLIFGFLVHVGYLLARIDWRRFPQSLTGPDSLLLLPGDLKDFFRHIAWFLGAKQAPQFDRWGYWEKFDYWAVFWGVPLLGLTGLLLAYPLAASHVIPGWGLNVAFWVHRIEALLAIAHVFIIHFFIGHLRSHNFPMDRAMFEGSVSLDEATHEKPAWIARLQQGGELQSRLVAEAPLPRRIVFYTIGYIAIALGVFLLIGGLVNVRYITW
jgi:thiosulfate reductase cytochrome b subunit